MKKETIVEINGKTVLSNGHFAYDGCHKIYIIENKDDKNNAIKYDYDILPIEQLEETYNNSCELRFIRNWKLTETYVAQFENAEFNIIESV